MIGSNRNKLRILKHQDFLTSFLNQEMVSTKRRSLIDQEARRRFFSNPHFNGPQDEYINPDSLFVKLMRRRKSVLLAGLVILILALTALAWFAYRSVCP